MKTEIRAISQNYFVVSDIEPLSNLQSENDGNRNFCLKKNVLDMYYDGDAVISDKFFQDGTNYQNIESAWIITVYASGPNNSRTINKECVDSFTFISHVKKKELKVHMFFLFGPQRANFME